MDKLGVKAGMRIAVLGVDDAAFLEQLTARTGAPDKGIDGGDLDIVFYEADVSTTSRACPSSAPRSSPPGAVWVVSPKGKGIEVRTSTSWRQREKPASWTPKSHRSPRRTRPCALSSRRPCVSDRRIPVDQRVEITYCDLKFE